jgi:hypothetical protein
VAEPIKIQFRPGINRETTNYGNTGGWFDCNLVRIKTGTWTSIGGWQPFTAMAAQGTFRSLFPWSVLDGTQYYGGGTNLKYYIVHGNNLVDITPIRKTVNPMANNPFATSSGTTTVTVTDVANGAVLNDFVTFSGATGPFGGVPASDINQEHQITLIVDSDHYTITVATTASSSTSGGGAAAVAAYQINVGLNTVTFGTGWGTGPWGSNGWGTSSGSSVATGQLRLWTQDNYGQNLLINPRDGGIYYKDMSGSLTARAVNLTSLTGADANTPVIARQVLVSNNDRHIVVFACNPEGSAVQDRMLFRWAATESLIDWTDTTTNSAGSLSLSQGSQFIQAIETTTEILVFTDIALISVRYVGAPFIFGQTLIGTNVQLLAPNGVASNGAVTAWIDNGRFRWYNGVVSDMPCDVRTYIFSILNIDQAEKIVAGTNRQFAEFIWLMPVNGSTENNFYVICNYENPSKLTWYYGSHNGVGRTTWLDAGFAANPLAASPDGYIYTHDIGTTANVAGQPAALIQSSLTSSVFELANGENFMLVSRTIPDIDFDGSTGVSPTVNFTFTKRDYPGSAFVDGPVDPVVQTVALPVSQYTEKIDKRFRARSVEIGVAAVTIGTTWSLGVPRLYAAPDGQRG